MNASEIRQKLHTGRSRNDQVALDMKLYTRDEIVEINDLLKELMVVIHRIMSENIDTFYAGLYPFAESSAGDTCSPFRGLILKCSAGTAAASETFMTA